MQTRQDHPNKSSGRRGGPYVVTFTTDRSSGEAAMTIMTGGCQCRRVRYAVSIDSDEAYLCHCNYCRRATGGVSIAFKNVRFADIEWTAAPPDWYQSSAIARRPFCSA